MTIMRSFYPRKDNGTRRNRMQCRERPAKELPKRDAGKQRIKRCQGCLGKAAGRQILLDWHRRTPMRDTHSLDAHLEANIATTPNTASSMTPVDPDRTALGELRLLVPLLARARWKHEATSQPTRFSAGRAGSEQLDLHCIRTCVESLPAYPCVSHREGRDWSPGII